MILRLSSRRIRNRPSGRTTAATAAVMNSFEGCAQDLWSIDCSASVSKPFARRFSSRPSRWKVAIPRGS